MDTLENQLRQLGVVNSGCEDAYVRTGKVAALVGNLQQKVSAEQSANNHSKVSSKTAPSIPPKPSRRSIEMPQVPLSKQVMDTQEPLFSQPLQSLEFVAHKETTKALILSRKQPIDAIQNGEKIGCSQSTLDNPAVLEQQLEALAYHKLQMEKRGLLGSKVQTKPNPVTNIPSLSSTSLSAHNLTSYDGYRRNLKKPHNDKLKSFNTLSEYSGTTVYSNMLSSQSTHKNLDLNHSTTEQLHGQLSICTAPMTKNINDELRTPPSPVSSSYSELRRANDPFNEAAVDLEESSTIQKPGSAYENYGKQCTTNTTTYYSGKTCTDFYGYGGLSQSSSTYDSIYEPINPRMSNDVLPRASFSTYANINQCKMPPTSSTCEDKSLTTNCGNIDTSSIETIDPSNCTNYLKRSTINDNHRHYNLTSIDSVDEVENYGRCFKCGDRVLGESSGCTAMDQIYHISCFTCTECQINLQGKPFYALEGNPFCEYDYLQTLEKCSVCLKPILERILRATGKPYHPQCFTCVVCGNSLDAIPFTVDATNQNYCIADFHKKFAPRCCVCNEPILPESGQEETVRVVALDRSFHLECYKCEDCGLLLSSEADGRGCYPLDDHVLCKSCNARRVQVLTNRMT
ncbi:zyxin isoform X1 [Drosophila nasuta]|uniref:zyxin isoform X1 n=1 Tax=Drosophila nasuta TaxID=42062 RepID=UPI00295E33BB|nr:zyxin isoform X1 [Drosophila nasuta]